jgi:hypothetical protein
VQLVYYSHSYRPADDAVNEFFQELMLDEQLIPSLDPKSDRLNAAKPERHLRSTDGMVAVLTLRDPAPSEYIRWEIDLGMRARRPQLIFVEDVVADNLVPAGLLQRRFSRRRLLREARDHRHAIRVLKTYVGTDPPPTYQPVSTRRHCVIIGGEQLGAEATQALMHSLERLRYSAQPLAGGQRLPDDQRDEEAVKRAALCIALVEGLTAREAYLLGVARSALTPTVLMTHDPAYPYHPVIPREYQPRWVRPGDAAELVRAVEIEIEIFEEDYLELVEEKQIRRYKQFQETLLRTRRDGYSQEARRQVFNFMGNTELDMSKDKIQVSGVVGPVNIKSRLDQVTQTVQQTPGWPDEQKQQLAALVAELQAGLQSVAEQRPEDAERVTRMAEGVVAEATKAKRDKGFLSLTVEGLKQAAQAVADIAPPVLATAAKVAAFIAGLK